MRIRARKHQQLFGLLMRPCALTQKDNERIIHSSDYAVKADYKKAYENHMIAMQIVAESAKIYILKNWKKVKSWADLEISIIDNTNKETYYFNYKTKPKRRKIVNKQNKSVFDEVFDKWDKDDKKNHNPIKKISNVVLDTTDGDFSLDINGKPHLWIDDDSVIVLADYIEKQLTKTSKQK